MANIGEGRGRASALYRSLPYLRFRKSALGLNWDTAIRDFINYLRLERGLSVHTQAAYQRDLRKAARLSQTKGPLEMNLPQLEALTTLAAREGISARSQARFISSLRSFYRYLVLEDRVPLDPTELLESPRQGSKLPEFLELEEIERIMASIDLGAPQGHRNRAILETLYGCGLRVSELTGLRLQDLLLDEGMIRVVGKGNKERLVPINDIAVEHIQRFRNEVRVHQPIKPKHEHILFLNQHGRQLTRAMIFHIVRQQAELAGIDKTVSPHTFRHSFATHLVRQGADLRAVQQMLGHASIVTTEIYTHLDQQYLKDVLLQYHPRARPS